MGVFLSNNILTFPKSNSRLNLEPSIESVKENLENTKFYHIEETIELIIPNLMNQISMAGFNFEQKEDMFDDSIFVMEAIRSLLNKYYEIYHPFQTITDNVFEHEADSIKITGKLNVSLYDEDDNEDQMLFDFEEC